MSCGSEKPRNARNISVRASISRLAAGQGSVEPGESTALAAVRELKEEAGIQSTVKRNLGEWRSLGQTWAFHECHVAEDLPDTWMHFAEDDGGHEFRFFWHPLMSEPSEKWHQVFKDALSFLRKTLAEA